jgi:ATP-dependent helicase/nuclease subunit B
LGALDEAPLALEGALELPPPVDPLRRLAVLSHLDLADERRRGSATHRRPSMDAGGELAT